MMKVTLFTAMALAAAPALAQSDTQSEAPSATPAPAATPEQAAVQQAASTFNQCVSAGVENVEASGAPEAAAAAVMSGCAAQRQQLEQAVGTIIASLPEERQGAARQQLQTDLDQIEPQVVAALRQRSAAPAPTE